MLPSSTHVIVVISDGEGNVGGGPEVQRQLARKIEGDEGIKVIGIGIGDGVEAVKHVYQHPVVVDDVTRLPRALGRILEEEVEIQK